MSSGRQADGGGTWSAHSRSGRGVVSGYPNLLSPFSIGRVGLRNRVVFQPHFTALGHLDVLRRGV